MMKYLYWFSLGLIGLWFIRIPVFWLLGLEFSDVEFQLNYSMSWLFILPISVFLTITRFFKNGARPQQLVRVLINHFLLSLMSIVLVFISIFGGFCNRYETAILYQSKIDDTRISTTEFGCGAYDSDPPQTEIRKIKPLNKYLIRTRKCDTTNLNLNIYQKSHPHG